MDVQSTNPGLTSRTAAGGAAPGVCFFAYFLCTSKESKALAAGEWKLWLFINKSMIKRKNWIPAHAGMTSEEQGWIPAFAGMTIKDRECGRE